MPGKSHGRRSLVGYSSWGCEESDTTEGLHFHCSLSCIGEGNGSPLQCSCLENPRDGGAWWAAIYGVAQSQTGLKRLSSSSSKRRLETNFDSVSLVVTRIAWAPILTVSLIVWGLWTIHFKLQVLQIPHLWNMGDGAFFTGLL